MLYRYCIALLILLCNPIFWQPFNEAVFEWGRFQQHTAEGVQHNILFLEAEYPKCHINHSIIFTFYPVSSNHSDKKRSVYFILEN